MVQFVLCGLVIDMKTNHVLWYLLGLHRTNCTIQIIIRDVQWPLGNDIKSKHYTDFDWPLSALLRYWAKRMVRYYSCPTVISWLIRMLLIKDKHVPFVLTNREYIGFSDIINQLATDCSRLYAVDVWYGVIHLVLCE